MYVCGLGFDIFCELKRINMYIYVCVCIFSWICKLFMKLFMGCVE